MNGTTTWLTDKVASLLPKTTATACHPFSSCNYGAACGYWTLYACCSLNGHVWCTNQGRCC